MTTIKAFIKRRPLLSYFILTFAISWGGILFVVGPSGISANRLPSDMQIALLFPTLVVGPSVAGLLLTVLIDGRAGLREFGSRLLRWRVGARWYAVALLTAPLVYAAVFVPLSLISPEFLPRILTTNDMAYVLLFGLGWGLIGGGLLEELGWTGFAVPTLLRLRYSILGTGLIVGVLWAALHFIVFFWLGWSSRALPLALFVPLYLFSVVVGMAAFRVLMVWVYERTGGSLLVAMFMHASYTAGTFILGPLTISGVAFLTYMFATAAVLWVAVGAVAVAQGGHLSREPLRRRVA